MTDARNECESGYPDHDFWEDGYGYQCRRCGVFLDDLEDEDG
ncbi:hypothetical protein ACWF8U_00795 [Streptomyces olivaceus]